MEDDDEDEDEDEDDFLRDLGGGSLRKGFLKAPGTRRAWCRQSCT